MVILKAKFSPLYCVADSPIHSFLSRVWKESKTWVIVTACSGTAVIAFFSIALFVIYKRRTGNLCVAETKHGKKFKFQREIIIKM